MRIKEVFETKKESILKQNPTFPEFSSQVNRLKKVAKISSIIATSNSYTIDSLCYLSEKHVNLIKRFLGHGDITEELKASEWLIMRDKYSSDSPLVFLKTNSELYTCFYNTLSTATPVSMYTGSLNECLRSYYDYCYSDYMVSLKALAELVTPPAKFVLCLDSLERYLNSLLELILTSDLTRTYFNTAGVFYQFNTKLLIDRSPVICQVTLDDRDKICSVDVTDFFVPPFHDGITINRSDLLQSRVVVTGRTIDHIIRSNKLPTKVSRKELNCVLTHLVNSSIASYQYIEGVGLVHYHKGKLCISFKFPDSDHYLVCTVSDRGSVSVIFPWTVLNGEFVRVLATAMKTAY